MRSGGTTVVKVTTGIYAFELALEGRKRSKEAGTMQKARGESDEVCVKYKGGAGRPQSPTGPATLIQTKTAEVSRGSGDTSKMERIDMEKGRSEEEKLRRSAGDQQKAYENNAGPDASGAAYSRQKQEEEKEKEKWRNK
ncbi:hypothetical protein N7523_004899 [Penicillium sp. IBT 18751x]|nr:hypothetical protein N7523_004899 [Penicillium sp. IBT 18751x]